MAITSVELKAIHGDGFTLVPPYPVKDHVRYEDAAILVLGADCRLKVDGRDFELPSESRHVVAVSSNGDIEWFIDELPSGSPDGYHRELWELPDNWLTRHDKLVVEFNPKTGSIIQSVPRNKLPVGEQIVSLSGEARSIAVVGGRIVVGCKRATHEIHAFRSDGTEIWRSDPDERRGYVTEKDGELWERVSESRGARVHYRLDPDTGDRQESVREEH